MGVTQSGGDGPACRARGSRSLPLLCVTLGKIATLLGLKVLVCKMGPSYSRGFEE